MRGSRSLRHAIGVTLLLALAHPADARVIRVEIGKLAFAPATIAAEIGDTIEWVNGDFIAHTATATDGAWDVMIEKGASASLVPDQAGTFDYFCRFHPNMKGRIEVTP